MLTTEQLESIIFSSHDCRFGRGHPPSPAADPAGRIAGLRHRLLRTGHEPLALQRRENEQPQIQPDGRPGIGVSVQIHRQRPVDALLHQSLVITHQRPDQFDSFFLLLPDSRRVGTQLFQHRLLPHRGVQPGPQRFDSLHPL